MVQDAMSFKDISCLELLWPFCLAEQNHFCKFCIGHNEKKFCEFILNLGQWFRGRCCLKDFLYGALAALLFSGAKPFMSFSKRASWEHSREAILNSNKWFRRRCRLKKKFTDDGRRTTDARRAPDEDRSHLLTLSLRLR